MPAIIYGLCALTSFLCTFLLAKAYRKDQYRLLLWGSLCFTGMTLSNILLVIDKLLLPQIDLSVLRHCVTLGSLMILLYGLIMDIE